LLALVSVAVAILCLTAFSAGCGGGDDDDITGITVPTSTDSPFATPVPAEPTLRPTASPTPEPVTVVEARDGEWYLTLSQQTVPAGTVVFNILNEGTILHNFRLARTDLDPGALPVDPSTYKVDEAQLDVLAATSDMPPGAAEQVILDLPPGKYVAFCNIEGHYEAGDYSGLTVE
jgi:uncharacterized cupredoxin-like copper-binding protein